MEIRSPREPRSPHETNDAIDAAGAETPARVDGRTLKRRARLRGWKLPITDGPFAESKEMLGS